MDYIVEYYRMSEHANQTMEGIAMPDRRKFSIFISSTYEDLKNERQEIIGVALENGFIPVGMEQFHAAPASQWEVITKMIDECDFYLLIIGGRYGSIDEASNVSYTEKEYDYAKSKEIPVIVLIKRPESITADKQDSGDSKYEKQKRLESFKNKVMNDKQQVDFFGSVDDLKYAASATLRNAVGYAGTKAGWVRYRDVVDIINEEAEERNKANSGLSEQQQRVLENMKAILTEFGNRLTDVEKYQSTREKMPVATKEDIENLFRVEDNTLIIGSDNPVLSTVGRDDVGDIPVDTAFLLVYAADGDGRILKIRTLSTPVQITTSGKQFMADNSQRESAKWQEALDRLIEWGWVKPVGYKGEIYELTGTGYKKAEWLKEGLEIDTTKEPLEELGKFDD